MSFLGRRSLSNLSETTWYLQKITQRAITKRDFSIIEGYRGRIEQELKFSEGASKARFGQSPHNKEPAEALDIIPCPFTYWEDEVEFRKVKEAFEEARLELIKEGQIPSDYELEYGQDWGWDSPHVQNKNWKVT